jgi:sarcosine oxidase subunit gamma
MIRKGHANALPLRHARWPPHEALVASARSGGRHAEGEVAVSALSLKVRGAVDRFGLKGPGAPAWLAAQGIAVPAEPNTWLGADAAADEALLVARLGSSEFFLEDVPGSTRLRDIEPDTVLHPPGVYPVLREDAAFLLAGVGALDVMAEVCNVDFGGLARAPRPGTAPPDAARPDAVRPLIMTSMVGVAVLVVPLVGAETSADGCSFRIWCDPTFGDYLSESLGTVVRDCGGNFTGVSA